MSPIRILIVDDQELFREGLGMLIAEQAGMVVVGNACDADSAVQQADKLNPDIVLMDITMPGKSGIEAARIILTSQPDCRIIALTAHEEPEVANNMFRTGATGFLLKDCTRAELVESIQIVHSGGFYVTPRLAQLMLESIYHQTPERKQATSIILTERETEVLRMLASGLNNKEVAWELGLSVKTVEAHRTSLMRKLGFRTIAELTHYAIATKLVSPIKVKP